MYILTGLYCLARLILNSLCVDDNSYANRSLNYWMPLFDDSVAIIGGHLEGPKYMAAAVDWLWDHPKMTTTLKRGFADKLIAWCNAMWEYDDEGEPPYAGGDTDHILAAGMGYFTTALVLHGYDSNADVNFDRAWWIWNYGEGDKSYANVNMQGVSVVGSYVPASLPGFPPPGWEYATGTDFTDLVYWWLSMENLGYEFPSNYTYNSLWKVTQFSCMLSLPDNRT